jgi:hypothetical protein
VHRFPDFDHQAGLDLQLFGIKQSKVGEDVARAAQNLDAFNVSFLP